RSLAPAEPRVVSAERWLFTGTSGRVDLARCLMAIRELRMAISHNPDETRAYDLLDRAYELLEDNEGIVMSGKATSTPTEHLLHRFRQRATALNFAIQTTPPPRTEQEREELARLHLRLALLYRRNNDLDLERDGLSQVRDLVGTSAIDPEVLK